MPDRQKNIRSLIWEKEKEVKKMEGKIETYLKGVYFVQNDGEDANSREYTCQLLDTEDISLSPQLLEMFGIDWITVTGSSSIKVTRSEELEWEKTEPVIHFLLNLVLFLYRTWENNSFYRWEFLKFDKYEEAISFFLETPDYEVMEKLVALEKGNRLRVLKAARRDDSHYLSEEVLLGMQKVFQAIEKQPLEDLARNIRLLLEIPKLYVNSLLIQDENEEVSKIDALSNNQKQVDIPFLLEGFIALSEILEEGRIEHYHYLDRYYSYYNKGLLFPYNRELEYELPGAIVELEENLELLKRKSFKDFSLEAFQKFAEGYDCERIFNKKEIEDILKTIAFAIEKREIIESFWEPGFDRCSKNDLSVLQEKILPLYKKICKESPKPT